MTAFKICGLTRPGDAEAAVAAGAAAVGVIFAASPRRVDIQSARAVLSVVPAGVARIGVFADQPAAEVERAVDACHLDWVQLSGSEPAERAEALARRVGVRVLKAVHVSGPDDIARFADYPAAAFLLDSPAADGRRGGTGRVFDWEAVRTRLREAAERADADGRVGDAGVGGGWRRVVVAGGLTPANVGEAIRRLGPAGVDVCSGVEASPGIKDPALLKRFAEAVAAAAVTPDGGPFQ